MPVPAALIRAVTLHAGGVDVVEHVADGLGGGKIDDGAGAAASP